MKKMFLFATAAVMFLSAGCGGDSKREPTPEEIKAAKAKVSAAEKAIPDQVRKELKEFDKQRVELIKKIIAKDPSKAAVGNQLIQGIQKSNIKYSFRARIQETFHTNKEFVAAEVKRKTIADKLGLLRYEFYANMICGETPAAKEFRAAWQIASTRTIMPSPAVRKLSPNPKTREERKARQERLIKAERELLDNPEFRKAVYTYYTMLAKDAARKSQLALERPEYTRVVAGTRKNRVPGKDQLAWAKVLKQDPELIKFAKDSKAACDQAYEIMKKSGLVK